MNDKELLELAAKAAGIKCDEHGPYTNDPAIHCEFEKAYEMLEVRKDWNPLENDAEAFRLMVRLGLLVSVRHESPRKKATVEVVTPYPCDDISVPFSGDGIEATRRAITRAAAERGMK